MPELKKNTPNPDKFLKLLKNKGLRATPQRLAVNAAMQELGHASADMVCEKLQGDGTKITVASVYNILTQFVELGIYSIRMSPTNKMFFDYTPGCHIHLYDTKNGIYRDIMDEEIQKIVDDYFKKHRHRGYKLDYVDIQLVCHSTKRKS